MIRSILLLLAMPISGLVAQTAPPAFHVVISAPNKAAFRVSFPSPRDSAQRPLIARGVLEYAADSIEVAALDTLNKVHVDAVQDGRVVASGDGAYLTVHRDISGVSIDVRSQVPASPTPNLRKPK